MLLDGLTYETIIARLGEQGKDLNYQLLHLTHQQRHQNLRSRAQACPRPKTNDNHSNAPKGFRTFPDQSGAMSAYERHDNFFFEEGCNSHAAQILTLPMAN